MRIFWLSALLTALASYLYADSGRLHFVVVGGLGGESKYEAEFSTYVSTLGDVFERTTKEALQVHVLRGPEARREAIISLLNARSLEIEEHDFFVLILIGHGTWDGRTYKFNIPGADLTSEEISTLVDAIPARRQLVTVTSSASGALIDVLKQPGRVIITATRSGRERNATVFAEYWVRALTDEAADSDKNLIITAAEAFQYTKRRVKDFYEREKRLAGEHPRMEGDLADSFTLARLKQVIVSPTGPVLNRLFEEREAITSRVENLKERKNDIDIEEYFELLEKLMVELSRKQTAIDKVVGDE